jgi:hypothetical protein
MNDTGVTELISTARHLMGETERDLLVFSGAINSENGDTFISQLLAHKTRRTKAVLFLCTYGGDPHAAYRMARVLRRCYPEDVRILIGSHCKSAGTMIALCADSLGFSDFGELGPLDTQLSRPDEVLQRASGLEVFSTLQYLTDHAFACFEQNMLTIIQKSGQTVSTRLASEIASRLATGLLKPITAQLDPYRIGIAQRGLEVTKVYGRQIANPKNLKSSADSVVEHLVNDYPTHAFVIDREEAGSLFQNVDGFSDSEQALFEQLRSALVRPAAQPFIVNFASLIQSEASNNEQESKNGESEQHSDREASTGREGEPVDTTPRRKANRRHPSASNKRKPSENEANGIEGTRLQ